MKTVTLLGIEVPVRMVDAVETPFIMIAGPLSEDQQYRKICPLWLQLLEQRPETLLSQMVWNKPSRNQSLSDYRAAIHINMIGLYEQMFAERTHAGVFADIPPGDDGEAYLLKSGHLYAVFADSIGAATRFCLRAIEATGFKYAMEKFPEAYRDVMEKLKA